MPPSTGAIAIVEVNCSRIWATATEGAVVKVTDDPYFTQFIPHPGAGGDKLPVSIMIMPDGRAHRHHQLKSAASPLTYPNGNPITAYSATSAPWSARMPASGPCW